MAKRKHRTTFEKVNAKFKAESQKQCYLVYCATALALRRHWNKKRLAIHRLFDVSAEIWMDCASSNKVSMIQICENVTGIEIRNEDGKSWRDVASLNSDYDIDPERMTYEQWVVLRSNQIRWVRPQIVACVIVALHRKWHFGFDRCARFYQQLDDIIAEYDGNVKRITSACLEETGIEIKYIVETERRAKG